jgi:hypothetical protein
MTPLVARVTAALVLLAIALFGAILWTWTGTTATETLRLVAAYFGVAWLAAWASTRRGTP